MVNMEEKLITALSSSPVYMMVVHIRLKRKAAWKKVADTVGLSGELGQFHTNICWLALHDIVQAHKRQW